MNAGICVNFLRHLLFLFIILQIVACTIRLLHLERCHETFKEKHLVNFYIPVKIRSAVFRSEYVVQSRIYFFIISVLITTIWAFIGAVCLHIYPKINFSAGMGLLCLVPLDLFTASDLADVSTSLEKILLTSLKKPFDEVNEVNQSQAINITELMNETKHANDTDFLNRKATNRDTFRLPMNELGWSPLVDGTERQRDIVDYIQLQFKCCGFDGRLSWDVRIPTSCCSEKYQMENCTIENAYKKSCSMNFNEYSSCLSSLQIQIICGVLLALAIVFCSLMLTKYKIKYPDENYDSETSSSDEETSED